MGIDLAIGESLFPLQAVVNEGIVAKATIFSIVVFNGEKNIGGKSFKSLFCLEGFITGGTGHNVIIVEARRVVNQGSDYLLLLICQLVFELGYKSCCVEIIWFSKTTFPGVYVNTCLPDLLFYVHQGTLVVVLKRQQVHYGGGVLPASLVSHHFLPLH